MNGDWLGKRNINGAIYARRDEYDQVVEFVNIDTTTEPFIERIYNGDGSFAHAYVLESKTGERIAELVETLNEVKWQCPNCGAILFDVREWTAVPYCDVCGQDVEWEKIIIIESYAIDKKGERV